MDKDDSYSYLSDACENESSNSIRCSDIVNIDSRADSIQSIEACTHNENDLLINIDSGLLRNSPTGERLITLTISTQENHRAVLNEPCDEGQLDPEPENKLEKFESKRTCMNKCPIFNKNFKSSDSFEHRNSLPESFDKDRSIRGKFIPDRSVPVRRAQLNTLTKPNCTQTPNCVYASQSVSGTGIQCRHGSPKNNEQLKNSCDPNASTSLDVTIELKESSSKKPKSASLQSNFGIKKSLTDYKNEYLSNNLPPNKPQNVTKSERIRNETTKDMLDLEPPFKEACVKNRIPGENDDCTNKITPEAQAGITTLHDLVDKVVVTLEDSCDQICNRNMDACRNLLSLTTEIAWTFESVMSNLCYSPLERDLRRILENLKQIIACSQEQPTIILNYMVQFGHAMSELGRHFGDEFISSTFPRLTQDIQVQISRISAGRVKQQLFHVDFSLDPVVTTYAKDRRLRRIEDICNCKITLLCPDDPRAKNCPIHFRTLMVNYDEYGGRPIGVLDLLNRAMGSRCKPARLVATFYECIDGEVYEMDPASLSQLNVTQARSKLNDATGDIVNGKNTFQLANWDKVRRL